MKTLYMVKLQRLDHMTDKGMKILVSKEKIPKLKEVEVGFCEPCAFGKQKRYFCQVKEDTQC